MATDRKSISTALRKQVFERDNRVCQKCSKSEKLCLHHIIPVADGEQIDTLENLITLCEHCHQEWEVIVYRRTDVTTFDEWLDIPPALELIAIFAQKNHWRDDITAKDARSGIIQAYQLVKELK